MKRDQINRGVKMFNLNKAARVFGFCAVTLLVGITANAGARFQQPTQQVSPSFSLAISIAKGVVKTGSPTQIDITVKNVSDHPISLSTLYIHPNVEITDHVTVVDPNGSKSAETELARRSLGHSTAADEARSPTVVTGKQVLLNLKAGQSFTYQLNIDELYDLSVPGKYSIQIERLDAEANVSVKSNKITITVTP
jgi:hypothetical protein